MQIRIDAQGLLSQLLSEVVVDYAETKAVDVIVADLIALQVNPYPVTAGTIEYSTSRIFTVPSDSIYGALFRLQEIEGGYITLDLDNHLNWTTTLGSATEKQIRYRKNLVEIKRVYDFSTLANRLYVFGDGVALVAGYVEDTDSQMANGYRAESITDMSVTDITTLNALAAAKLAALHEPEVSYIVTITNPDAIEESYALGDAVRIIDEELGINVLTSVIKITRNLSESMFISIELAALRHDITEMIGKDYRWKREFY